MPYTPGTDGAGTVVGSGAFEPGTLVWVRGGGLGLVTDGTCAELVLAPDEAVHVCPPGADPWVAACFFSPCASAHVSLHDVGGLRAGERVAITGGAGAVGSVAVQLAQQARASEVIAVVSRAERVGDVPTGATVVVGDAPFDEVDLLVDTVGGPGLSTRVARVVPGGRVVLVGYTAGTVSELDVSRTIQRDVRLLPLNMIRRQAAAAAVAAELLEALAAGTLKLAVTRLPLDRIADAWQLLAGGRARGRVVVEP